MRYIVFFIVLYLPLLALSLLGEYTGFRLIVDMLFVAAVVVSMLSLNSHSLVQQGVKLLLMALYLCVLFFSFLETMIFRFAGHGFNAEVFYHISWESFDIGVAQFGSHLIALIILMVFFIGTVFYFSKHLNKLLIWQLIIGVIVLVITSPYSSAGRFIKGWVVINKSRSLSVVDDEVINSLASRGFINHRKVPVKQLITAEAPNKKNLIIIYLESFNQFFLDKQPFNELTPGLKDLSDRFQSFDHESSAYVTIEGIAASLCGTLLPMQSGNSSFMPGSGYLENLPCLSDVLSAAGYEQYYLGGAVLEFAGKGHFLKTHGYDDVRGMAYWQEKGLESKKSFWGLSDADLFDQAIKTIEQAKSPYNLTLLTLGTHIPGFTYRGCPEPNDNEDAFISAIRCTDYLVERFVNELEAKGLLEDTLLVIVADHGVFPNPDMKKLFGELVYDRRLVGITNHPEKIKNQPIASYDLAPTILEWLSVSHNARFLFGQSVESSQHSQHKHLTRYNDWHNRELVENSTDPCDELSDSGILKKCEKEHVINWTHSVQSQFTELQEKPIINCKINLKVDLSDKDKLMVINGHNYYHDVYYSGYFLTTRKYKQGWFIFDLNDQLALEALTYLPVNVKSNDVIKSHKNQKTNGFGIYIKVQNEREAAVVEYFDKHDWYRVQVEPDSDQVINFCRNQ